MTKRSPIHPSDDAPRSDPPRRKKVLALGISAACLVVGAVVGAIPAHAAMTGDDGGEGGTSEQVAFGTSDSWGAGDSVSAPGAGSTPGTFVIAKRVSRTFTGSGPTGSAATALALAKMGPNCHEDTVVVLYNRATRQYDATVYASCTEPDDTCPAEQQTKSGSGVDGRCPS